VRIVDITEFYSERGGVRNHLDLKGRILRRLGHQYVIVAPGTKDEVSDLPAAQDAGSLPDDAEPASGGGNARVVRIGGPTLPYDSNYHLLWRLDKVRRVVMLERPDVLEINSPYLAALALRSLRRESVGIKTFWWHADVIDTYAVEKISRLLGTTAGQNLTRPLWALVRSIASGCDATFAASRHQADKLRAHGIPRVHHVSFGIDKEVFTPGARSESWRRGVAAGSTKAPILVAMGRLSGEKQWPVVLEGFARFRARQDAKLVIFGDGPERVRLEQKVAGRTDVVFMGFEPDRAKLAPARASADAFVHGCPFETFGLSVAQAIACGTPVVVPDRGGAAELAHPSFAEIFSAGDADALARALDRWSKRDPQALRVAAIRGRDALFGAAEQVRRTLEVYRELLASRTPVARATSRENGANGFSAGQGIS
jgi:alpha-1,6-mannosyltransferase